MKYLKKFEHFHGGHLTGMSSDYEKQDKTQMETEFTSKYGEDESTGSEDVDKKWYHEDTDIEGERPSEDEEECCCPDCECEPCQCEEEREIHPVSHEPVRSFSRFASKEAEPEEPRNVTLEKKGLPAGLKAYLDKKRKGGATSKSKSKGKAKPDFLDLDKDGDKKEPMKKAAEEAKAKKK